MSANPQEVFRDLRAALIRAMAHDTAMKKDPSGNFEPKFDDEIDKALLAASELELNGVFDECEELLGITYGGAA